jgi:carbamoyltransferase
VARIGTGGNVLGISAYYHDASAALVSRGEVIAAAAEERFTRQKHDRNFPRFAVAFCLEQKGLAARDIDAVAFYEEPHVKFTRVLASTLADFPYSLGHFTRSMKQWLGEKLWMKNRICAELDVPPGRVHFVPHHLSHAAQAFSGSPFDEAAILTLDAVGEWDCTTIGLGCRGPGSGVRMLESTPYPHSLGLVYSAFTAFLGFRPNDGECSTMALAAFGEPMYTPQVRQVIRLSTDGTYRIDDRFFDFLGDDGRLFRPAFLELFGPPRDFRTPWPFDALEGCDAGIAPPSDDDRRYADLAASVQSVLGDAILGLAARAHRLTGRRCLCMAGGVALNAVANARLIEEGPFDQVFIPPEPGDGGGALGAALYHSGSRWGYERRPVLTPFLGKRFPHAADAGMLREIDPADWTFYLRPGARATTRSELADMEFEDLDELVAAVVRTLEAGGIVGWLQDRFEVGPRALGNRSILADPGNLETVRRLSRCVKGREAFRPYALSVTEEDAPRIFDLGVPVPWPARWMQTVARVRPDALGRVRGAVHVDGTTRPQVCTAGDNPRFHRLLTAFGRVRGLAALLNTSLNERGYPLVASPSEAMLVFARTDMDTLVFNNHLVSKTDAKR